MTRGRPTDELELKARITDVAGLRRALRAAGARLEFRGRMVDRRYDRARELTRRDQVLRLRVYVPGRGHDARAELTWKGPASARRGYRHRQELECGIDDADVLRTVLAHLRYRITLTVDRRVEVYRLGGAMLRLEQYPRMDTLLEVEGSPRAIERAIKAIDLPRELFLSESLPYFTRAFRQRTGRPARLAWGGS